MKTKIINYIKNNKLKLGLILVLIVFAGGASFRKIFDNHTRKRKEKIEYIVVHYTANTHSGADAEANALYLKKKRNAGCHYIIDDNETIQCVPEDRVAFAVGDRKWLGFIPKPWYKGKIFNENSLSYEMCLGGGRNDSLIVDQTAKYVAWQLYDKSMFHGDTITIVGTKYIRKVPDLGRVVRHHDVSGKHCPRFFYSDSNWNQEKEDKAFFRFKKKVDEYFKQLVRDREIK